MLDWNEIMWVVVGGIDGGIGYEWFFFGMIGWVGWFFWFSLGEWLK